MKLTSIIRSRFSITFRPYSEIHCKESITIICKAIKKAIYDALSLPWASESGLLSPVKKSIKSENSNPTSSFKWIRTILLIGDFEPGTNGKEILTNQIAKQLRTNDIKLVYISDKSLQSPFPATVPSIPSSNFPTKVSFFRNSPITLVFSDYLIHSNLNCYIQQTPPQMK